MAISETQTDPIRHRDELVARVESIFLQDQLEALEHARQPSTQVQESWGTEPAPRRRGFDDDAPIQMQAAPDAAHDRANGDYWPIFQGEWDIAAIRGVSRFLAETSYGQGILGSLKNYVVHTGFTYDAMATRKKETPAALVAQVQAAIDRFISDNRWELDFEQELFDGYHTDGEVVLALEADGDQVRARRAEPSWLTEPADKDHLERKMDSPSALNWKYGIATDKHDATRIHGYFVQWNGDPSQWSFYRGGGRIIHLKANTPRHVKRGLSDFYPVDGQLNGATELLRRMTKGAGIQSSIALIVEAATGTGSLGIGSSSQIGDLGRTNGGGSGMRVRADGSYASERYSDWGDGTVIDTRGKKFQAGPMAGTQAANYIEVLQAGLRAIGTRWNMPEYMVSGDASNNNFASILESGSPFVRAVESRQERLVKAYERMLWSVVRIQFELGKINLRRFGITWQELRQAVNIVVGGTSPAVRDRGADFAVDSELHNKGAVSLTGLASKYDWDPEEEQERREEAGEVKPVPMPGQPQGQPTPGGLPGLRRFGMPSNPAPVPTQSPTQQPAADDAESRLNGAQITAAKDVLMDVSSGRTAAVVAVELLTALSISPERAQRMVKASQAIDVQAKDDKAETDKALAAARESWNKRRYP